MVSVARSAERTMPTLGEKMSLSTEDRTSIDAIKDYYGTILSSSSDLQTSACCVATTPPAHILAALRNVHDEVKDKFYGCGSPIPAALDGITVLDLGCGTGRDCYVLSQLAGSQGRVIGVDMTDEQLSVARRHLDYHAEKVGYSNIEFRAGYIEDLATVGIEDSSVDLVVSNCVLNLSPDKPRVFDEIFRVLKPGGELYFSDVFADRRVPSHLREDEVLLGECLSGALYTEDLRRYLANAGCADVRTTASAPITIDDPEIDRKIGFISFTSHTVRAFALQFEDKCEDYGQIATYHGTLHESPHAFDLDDHHRFVAGKPMPVCGNTASMLTNTRYAQHFTVTGDQSVHFGLFPCDTTGSTLDNTQSGCC